MRNIVRTTIITASVMAGLAMPAGSGKLADDAVQCKQLGYKPGTALFLKCLGLYQQQRALGQAQAQSCSGGRTGGGSGQTGGPMLSAAEQGPGPGPNGCL